MSLAGAAFACTLFAVETRFWQQYEAADYEKATLKGLSLQSDGRLSLAPVFQEILDSSTAHLWAVAEDSKGNIYIGGGAPGSNNARLIQVDVAGKSKTLVELAGLEIHAIAVDRGDRVYAATSPDGKVYRISGSGNAEVFYDPKAKYIWAMAFNSRGELFVATGDRGEIHKVSVSGQGSLFFQSEETHARSLAIDLAGNLIVGTEPGGLVLRVSAAGEGFVLYQSSKREVTSVAVSREGLLYAAAVGSKQPLAAPPPPPPAAAPGAAPPAGGTATITVTRTQPAPVPATLAPAPSISGGSEIWRIDKDGSPRRVWSHGQEIVYAIGFDAKGRVLVGTGNRGRIYRLEDERLYTTLVSSASTQITAFLASRRGPVYAATANVGKLFRLGPELEKEGTIESEVFDAGAFSYWGRARWDGKEAGGAVSIETRSGNLDRPHKNWSDWSSVAMNSRAGRTSSPAARFLQYRLKLGASPGGASPEISLVEMAYLTRNAAPAVEEIETTPANYRFPAPSTALASSQTLTLPPMGQRRRSGATNLDGSGSSMNYAKGHIGARWRASDENGDTLVFKVEIRGLGETQWKLLKDNVKERHLSWDSTAFADGEYQIRVTASDSPGNAPAQALSASLESDPFLIDNTAPQITGLAANAEQGRVVVRWKARDTRSVIEKAEYSVNGGEWLLAPPVSRLADSLELDYALTLERAGSGEMTIAVRVTDEFENQAVDKVTLR
ncbi:MAG: hypothetical protein HY235_30080 [Acidobacteria bacterium]|nr:hypothetical protein [Acidobacteriota bacterium]